MRRLDGEHNGRVWHAWNSVALSRAKRLPPMRSLLAPRRAGKRQTTQDMMALCQAIARGYGGKVA